MRRKTNTKLLKEYPFLLRYDPEDEVYIGMAVDLKGCHSDGKTPEEATMRLEEAMAGWLETAKKNGIPIPRSSATPRVPKRFLLRLDPENALKIESLSAASGKSVNTIINEAIERT